MGKSLGNTLEPKDLVERFGADAVRYFFLREVEFGNDGDYSEERFINIVNAHLANTIGICFCITFIYSLCLLKLIVPFAFFVHSAFLIFVNYACLCVDNDITLLI